MKKNIKLITFISAATIISPLIAISCNKSQNKDSVNEELNKVIVSYQDSSRYALEESKEDKLEFSGFDSSKYQIKVVKTEINKNKKSYDVTLKLISLNKDNKAESVEKTFSITNFMTKESVIENFKTIFVNDFKENLIKSLSLIKFAVDDKEQSKASALAKSLNEKLQPVIKTITDHQFATLSKINIAYTELNASQVESIASIINRMIKPNAEVITEILMQVVKDFTKQSPVKYQNGKKAIEAKITNELFSKLTTNVSESLLPIGDETKDLIKDILDSLSTKNDIKIIPNYERISTELTGLYQKEIFKEIANKIKDVKLIAADKYNESLAMLYNSFLSAFDDSLDAKLKILIKDEKDLNIVKKELKLKLTVILEQVKMTATVLNNTFEKFAIALETMK
ncbi:hypothetical protein [Mycoplasmopsis alligatoris]|uniref:Lipoprotein n=1 Tax=Mycoplasmopsis alligatoris A21JP2 TaxID=747682 RepID=D4XUZ7_9BACT|nr:hypothetical protein [Mycoplasmopsis alligatoris]EFF41853.1 hypothetical protein MALL_0155 [Mycoplasmopsis alligatoris A21JP2]